VTTRADDGSAGPPAGRAAREARALAMSVAAVATAAAVGGLAASGSDPDLYESLDLPSWAPPDWVFSPVWVVLYIGLAIAGWLVARQGLRRTDVRIALALFGVHLVFQAAWTPIFFRAELFWWALADIVVALVTGVAAAAAMGRVSRWAGALMVPYVAWLAFAAALNAAVVALN
jgi:translocator protein